MTEFDLPQLFPVTNNGIVASLILGIKRVIKNLVSVQKTGRHYTPVYQIQKDDDEYQIHFQEHGIGSLEETRHFCIVNTLVKLSAFPQSHEGKKCIVLQHESKFSV